MTQRTLNNYIKQLRDILCKDYDHEQNYVPRTRDFTKIYRKMIKSMIKNEGWELSFPTLNYCEVSFFIRNQNKYVYVSTSDFRWGNEEWRNNILIRTAKNDKDYHGGSNYYTSLEEFVDNVKYLFKIWR